MTSEIFNIDCVEYMRTIPDKFFDLAVCDPPYGINAGKMTMGSGVNRPYSHDKDWDAGIPGPEYFEELFRVSREQIIFGGNYFPLPLSEDWIVWDKMNDGRSFSEAELAWCSVHRKMRIFHFRTTTPVKGGKIHPTQKPVELYSWIFANYARGGAKILDTHLGSGSSRIAAYYAGMDFYGCEIDPEYFAAAEQRFKRECRGIDIVGGKEIQQLNLFDL